MHPMRKPGVETRLVLDRGRLKVSSVEEQGDQVSSRQTIENSHYSCGALENVSYTLKILDI